MACGVFEAYPYDEPVITLSQRESVTCGIFAIDAVKKQIVAKESGGSRCPTPSESRQATGGV